MPELLFTIGPPRSGKSTYCTVWANAAPNRAIVCGDSIRQALGFEFRQENETLVQGIKDTMIRALLNRGQDVIVDGTHSTEGSIRRIFRITSEAKPIIIDFHKYFIYDKGNSVFQKYVEELVHRGIETKGEYIVEPIKRISNNIQQIITKYGLYLNELRSNV